MFASPPLWRIPLDERPRIAHCALACHNTANTNLTDRYFLPDLWTLHLYRYHAQINIPRFSQAIHPGSLTIFPPATPLSYAYREVSHHLYVHFRLENNLNSPLQIAMHTETGADNERWNRELWFLIESFRAHPLRAEVKLWELLFELCERHQGAPTHHPSLEKALQIIELRLAEPLSPALLAHEVGLSHNHLIRLFQKETGGSISAYIRARRAQRALHLLQNTTLPLVSVAAQVGARPGKALCDLLKRETGMSPRRLRTRQDPKL
jgi:AraC-like DNA-binding protein